MKTEVRQIKKTTSKKTSKNASGNPQIKVATLWEISKQKHSGKPAIIIPLMLNVPKKNFKRKMNKNN